MPQAAITTAPTVLPSHTAERAPAPITPLPPADGNWEERAACKAHPVAMFFPSKGEPTKPALRVCDGCDVREQCLEFALKNNEEFGIWGGTTSVQRKRMLQERRLANSETRTRRVRQPDPKTLARNEEIRRARDEGNVDVRELAERYGLSVNTIYRITGSNRSRKNARVAD